ncbi:tudor and KH domain-containing protein-like [Ruditapes philippinarum]|uniref:tudor and KH domain-containing protein-like n=1 Tax=Ruditapes philippinarum TaxID=129788 RepID=UPI00295AF39E|nr:tudor and KH domain-containing protein-like [Ruditapes philippinarum]XP_060582031.1 tudor and KH domain-containing protein-like [Ruditapes philippinarum]
MFEISQQGKLVILGIGIPTTLGLLYYLLKSSSEDEYDEVASGKSSVATATSRQTVIELQVPRKAVGAVIGRQGATIKEIQEQTGARVNFKEDSKFEDADRTVIIRGTPESAQSAECRIRHILANMPVMVQSEMEVPKYALGRIIGRGGESIRHMSRASQTKILIDKTRSGSHDKPQIITIVGSQDQIIVAKSLIQEKLDEEEEFRARSAVSAANRETRQKDFKNNQSNDRMTHSANSKDPVHTDNCESYNTETIESKDLYTYTGFPKGRDFVEVYVSAIATPGHFWVQVIGAMALELDKLSDTMTRFYNSEGQKQLLPSVVKGDIVAAPFENDRTWYRAKVMDIKEYELDLFYVDYGDSAYMDSSLVKSLW